MTTEDFSGLDLDWAQLYPVLKTYQKTVDCAHYDAVMAGLVQQLRTQHGYSLEDAMLVLKDRLYQTFLRLKKSEP